MCAASEAYEDKIRPDSTKVRLDERDDWVADLECAHQQRVRHDPPWTTRHWVTTPQGRREHPGRELECVACQPNV